MGIRLIDRMRRHPLVIALALASSGSVAAALAASCWVVDTDLRKAIYAGASTLFFGGFLGGVLKQLFDEVVATKRRREDAAGFVDNILSDLKRVYDRVARARTLIPAHQSVKTYGDEMRGLIEARVDLRNITRALERSAEGVDSSTSEGVTEDIEIMRAYLDGLIGEFRQNYKALSDQQRGYEERAKALLEKYAESSTEEAPPELPGFVWKNLSELPKLSDFIGDGKEYTARFEDPLDDASEILRQEHARILHALKRHPDAPGFPG